MRYKSGENLEIFQKQQQQQQQQQHQQRHQHQPQPLTHRVQPTARSKQTKEVKPKRCTAAPQSPLPTSPVRQLKRDVSGEGHIVGRNKVSPPQSQQPEASLCQASWGTASSSTYLYSCRSTSITATTNTPSSQEEEEGNNHQNLSHYRSLLSPAFALPLETNNSRSKSQDYDNNKVYCYTKDDKQTTIMTNNNSNNDESHSPQPQNNYDHAPAEYQTPRPVRRSKSHPIASPSPNGPPLPPPPDPQTPLQSSTRIGAPSPRLSTSSASRRRRSGPTNQNTTSSNSPKSMASSQTGQTSRSADSSRRRRSNPTLKSPAGNVEQQQQQQQQQHEEYHPNLPYHNNNNQHHHHHHHHNQSNVYTMSPDTTLSSRGMQSIPSHGSNPQTPNTLRSAPHNTSSAGAALSEEGGEGDVGNRRSSLTDSLGSEQTPTWESMKPPPIPVSPAKKKRRPRPSNIATSASSSPPSPSTPSQALTPSTTTPSFSSSGRKHYSTNRTSPIPEGVSPPLEGKVLQSSSPLQSSSSQRLHHTNSNSSSRVGRSSSGGSGSGGSGSGRRQREAGASSARPRASTSPTRIKPRTRSGDAKERLRQLVVKEGTTVATVNTSGMSSSRRSNSGSGSGGTGVGAAGGGAAAVAGGELDEEVHRKLRTVPAVAPVTVSGEAVTRHGNNRRTDDYDEGNELPEDKVLERVESGEASDYEGHHHEENGDYEEECVEEYHGHEHDRRNLQNDYPGQQHQIMDHTNEHEDDFEPEDEGDEEAELEEEVEEKEVDHQHEQKEPTAYFPPPPQKLTKLYDYARRGNWDLVVAESRQHPRDAKCVNEKDGTTALHLAVMSRTNPAIRDGKRAGYKPAPRKVIKELLKACPEAAIIRCSVKKYTPLAYACLVCDREYDMEDAVEILRIILDYAPQSIYVFTDDGFSPLDVHILSYSRINKQRQEVPSGNRSSTVVLRALLAQAPFLADARTYGNKIRGPLELLYRCNLDEFKQAGDADDHMNSPDKRMASTVASTLSDWWAWKWALLLLKFGALDPNDRDAPFCAVKAAARHIGCPIPILNLAIQMYPDQVKERDPRDDLYNLPLHQVASWRCDKEIVSGDPFVVRRKARAIEQLLEEYPEAARTTNNMGETALQLAIEACTPWEAGLEKLVRACPKALKFPRKLRKVTDDNNNALSRTLHSDNASYFGDDDEDDAVQAIEGMYPFMIAAIFGKISNDRKREPSFLFANETAEDHRQSLVKKELESVRTIYGLLRARPDALQRYIDDLKKSTRKSPSSRKR